MCLPGFVGNDANIPKSSARAKPIGKMPISRAVPHLEEKEKTGRGCKSNLLPPSDESSSSRVVEMRINPGECRRNRWATHGTSKSSKNQCRCEFNLAEPEFVTSLSLEWLELGSWRAMEELPAFGRTLSSTFGIFHPKNDPRKVPQTKISSYFNENPPDQNLLIFQ